MVILGIDPAWLSWATGIEYDGVKARALDYGVVSTPSDMETLSGCSAYLILWKS